MIEETLHGLVDVEALRDTRDLLADLAQLADIDTGIAAARILDSAGRLEPGPAAVEPVGFVRLVAQRRLVFGIEMGAPAGLYLLDFHGGDDAFADQFLAVYFSVVGCERIFWYISGWVNK